MHIYLGCYVSKKGGETSESKILRSVNIEIPNMTGDKIGVLDGWVIKQLGDTGTSLLPLGRHASILYCRRDTLHKIPAFDY